LFIHEDCQFKNKKIKKDLRQVTNRLQVVPVTPHKHHHLEVLSDSLALLALKMSLPRLKNLSTSALEGTAVLYFESIGSPMKVR
jgi:hypothetical protein